MFDYSTMKVVTQMRGNKEDSQIYKEAFELMFRICKLDESNFALGETLKGIIIDWSDTEARG